MRKQTILVSGLAATYPVGGVFWDYLQYLQGFTRLGNDCYYLEDHGGWTFDPLQGTFTDDPKANVEALAAHLRALEPGLEKRFCVRDTYDKHWGLSREELAEVVKRATVFLNVSMTCQLREEYLGIPVKILIDSDPLYSQTGVPSYLDGTADEKTRRAIDNMRQHDVFFSFGELVGAPDCLVPSEIFDWKPTRQPIVLDAWANAAAPKRDVFTTVLSWKPVESGPVVRGVTYGGKNLEFERFIDLPARTSASLELALGGGQPPRDLLAAKGWQLADGYAMSDTPWRYRDYILDSQAEFSMAKNAYVASRSGWFSCRTACYLAAGRPAVVQDTGFSRFMDTGDGVIPFATMDEAVAGIERIRQDWPKQSEAALAFAKRYFDSADVLTRLLRDASV